MSTTVFSTHRVRGPGSFRTRFVVSIATAQQRETIYRLRHHVYAEELGQHSINDAGLLTDALDATNIYLVACVGEEIAGFISLTPPGSISYSIDKYFSRESLPFDFDKRLFEIRLLTVLKAFRGGELATLLMYAAMRWVEAHGGNRIAAIGRREVVEMYERCGLERLGLTAKSGAVTYEAMQATITDLHERSRLFSGLLQRLESKTEWRFSFPFWKPAACFHGGAFFDGIGPQFDTLEKIPEIINADVLDAWFPPSPSTLSALQNHLPWLVRTSPPTDCVGLLQAISHARGVPDDCLLPGAGSSDLIFRAFRHWLRPGSHALILDPTYGEYAHVLEQVIGCVVDRLSLSREKNYAPDLARLEAALADNYDLIVLVNPNSPTGNFIPRGRMAELLRQVPISTRVWIDETYIDYAGTAESMESFASQSENVIVCKSMSKVYALSGVRAAYLCGGPHQLEALRAITPPWVVGLPAQLAAVRALQDPAYYQQRYLETHQLRRRFADGLGQLGLDVTPGIANFVLCHLPEDGPDAPAVVRSCRQEHLYIRDASAMSSNLGNRALRIAVKDAVTNSRMISILDAVLRNCTLSHRQRAQDFPRGVLSERTCGVKNGR